MRPKSRYHALFRISFRKSISPRRAARPPLPRADADDRARRPPRLSQTNRLRRHVILRHQLRRSPRLARGGSPPSSASVSRRAPPRPVTAARKLRGKETIDHLYDMLYPKSLVAGNKGTPVSVQAGVRRRARASRERERRTSCPVHATPARMNACDAAAAAADAALDRYHEAKRLPYGDEDGALHDVIRLSLAKVDVCVVDQWDKQE